jgi:thiol-disulfide isomerase/thioredoxin
MRTRTRPHWTIAAVLVLFALPAVLSVWSGRWAAQQGRALVGGALPVFHAQTAHDEIITSDDLRGGVTVLNFWATWCGPCQAEMPLLQAVHAPNDGVRVIAINNGEGHETVLAYAQALGLTFPLVLDRSTRLQRAFHIYGYPTTVFVNATGTIYAIHTGALSPEQLARYLTDAHEPRLKK